MGKRRFRVLHLFSGMGGGARGFQQARAQLAGITGEYELVGAVDLDGPSCADFETLTGTKATIGDIAKMTIEVHDELRLDPPPIIVAVDGTWHRPLTTLELLAIQSFPTTVNGRPLVLHGKSHGAWRERIGNAVPPDAAQAIGEAILDCLLAHEAGLSFRLGGTDFWVHPEMPEALAS